MAAIVDYIHSLFREEPVPPENSPNSVTLPEFNKLNDLYRISFYAANDVYLTDPKGEEVFTTYVEIDDHSEYKFGDGQRVYKITRYIYHPDERAEFSCIYTAECEEAKTRFAFIAWKGTSSGPQAFVDFKCVFQSEDSWRTTLESITGWFLPKIPEYLGDKKISANDYEWYCTGHSLGGALAIMAADSIRMNPALLLGSHLQNIITFASMKVPQVILPNDGQYAQTNRVIEFFNKEDRLPEEFCPSHSIHVGHPRIDINLCLPFHIPHQLDNFNEFFNYHYVKISDEGFYTIL
jgi:hypothetical protein